MIKELRQFEAGMYADANEKGFLSFGDYLDHLAENGDVDAGLLPTRDERREAAGRPVTAVQHLLAAHGIRTKGQQASTGGVFVRGSGDYVDGADRLFPAFVTDVYDRHFAATDDAYFSEDGSDGSLLFPTTVNPQFADYRRARRNRVQLTDIVGATIGIDGDAYKSGYVDHDAEDELEPGRVTEGADLPLYTLRTGDRDIRIHKYGGRVRASYEFLRRVRLNKLAMTIQGIARREEVRKLRAAIAVALNGDGNANPAQNVAGGGSGAWLATDFDLLEAEMNEHDREPTLYVGDKDTVLAIRALRQPAQNFQLTPDQVAMYGGSYQTPSGSPLRFAPAGSALNGSNKLLTWGEGDGLELVRENGSVVREADRFISNQTQEFTISENVGFAKPDPYGHWTVTRS